MINEHFDPLDILYRDMLREAYTKDTEDLISWLTENHFFHNTRAFDEGSSQASIKWKEAMLNSLGTMIQSSATWISNQLAQDSPFMDSNQGILLDPNRYPVRLPPIQGGPNFASALQRLSTPLAAALRGFDIGKIEDDPKANLSFKKTIVPSYDPRFDWTQFCKQYFKGELPADKTNYQPQQMSGIIKLAYQFAGSAKTRFNTIKQDFDQIVNFINDSSTGSISNQLNMDQKKLQQMQVAAANKRSAGMASTSPGANSGTTNPVRPVNADTSYEYFMEEYFEEAVSSQAKPATQSANPKPVSSDKPETPTSNSNKTADSLAASKAPMGAQVDPNRLAEQKRQVVAEIVRAAASAKLAAMTSLYFSMMQIMKAHVASYGGNVGQQQPQQQMAPAQQPVQPQQQAPQQTQQQ